MKTQIAFSDQLNPGKFAALTEQAARMGVIRSEVWQRFGSLQGIGVRDRWLKEGRQFPVSANAWKQTLCDAIGDIEAAITSKAGDTSWIINTRILQQIR